MRKGALSDIELGFMAKVFAHLVKERGETKSEIATMELLGGQLIASLRVVKGKVFVFEIKLPNAQEPLYRRFIYSNH